MVIFRELHAGGSSNHYQRAVVYERDQLSGAISVRHEVVWDTHFGTDLPYVEFHPRSQILTARTARYRDGDGHCCASAMDVIRLQWDGRRFAELDRKTAILKSR